MASSRTAARFDGVVQIDSAALNRELDAVIRLVLLEGTLTVQAQTRGLEKDLEAATKAAVKGRLWRAWKSAVYPKGPRAAREPVGEVFANGGKRSQGAITFFTQEGRITAGGGGYLAIPTEAAGSQGRARNLTPGEWERRTGRKLRFVYRRKGPSLLVLDEGVLSGKARIAAPNTARRREAGRGDLTIAIFTLVPYVNFQPRVSIGPLLAGRERKLALAFESRLQKARRLR